MKKDIIQSAKVLVLALLLGAGLSYAQTASFTPPPCSSPANCNVAAPINTGATGQTKTGSLGVAGGANQSFVSFGTSLLLRDTSIGSAPFAGLPAFPAQLNIFGGAGNLANINGGHAKFGDITGGSYLDLAYNGTYATIDGQNPNPSDRGILLNFNSGGDFRVGGGPGGASNSFLSGDVNAGQNLSVGQNATITGNTTVVNGKLSVGTTGASSEKLQVLGGAMIDNEFVTNNLDVGHDVTVDNNLLVSSAVGAGNAYACFDAGGQIFRSNDPCVTVPPPTNGTSTFTASGTTTWTVPAGATSVHVKIWGGGGGGGAAGNAGSNCGADGTLSQFKFGTTITVTAQGGHGGKSQSCTFAGHGTGGTASGGNINNNTGGSNNLNQGGSPVPFPPNFTSGKGGNGGSASNVGEGGGAGGYAEHTLNVGPNTTFTITVGTGGAGGTGSQASYNGTNGGQGYVSIDYQ